MEDIMRVKSRKLEGFEQEYIKTVKQAGNVLAADIKAYTKAGREQSLALTKLEEAIMWASKAITK